jgi:hypothetical protein
LEEDTTDASRRITGDEKSRMKRNNVKSLGIRKDNIKMDLKEIGYYIVDKTHLYLEKVKLCLLSPRNSASGSHKTHGIH